MSTIDEATLATDTHALDGFNSGIVDEFRANGGKVAALPGGEVLLLHTTGAKSGKPRLSPLAYLTVDDRTLVAGSFLGAATDPSWVHNLRANPRARIEVGTGGYDVIARELPPAERDELYPRAAQVAPVLADYQAKTGRVIPLFELTRA